MSQNTVEIETTAEALLLLLRERGVRYLFATPGSDAAPLIEAYARMKAVGREGPVPIAAPHEMSAVSMAHGYTMVTGEPASVLVHVTVGTANAAAGIMNASRMGIPMIVLAGRTPIFEKGAVGARNRRIHWSQESFDQAAMIREYLKWDYELRDFAQLNTVVDRAVAMAKSHPQGPVYLTLPREQLAARQNTFRYTALNRFDADVSVQPGPENISKAGELIAHARRPLVLAGHLGRDPLAVGELIKLAEAWALPVVESFPFSMNFPADHPLHLGFSVDPYLEEADLVLAVETDVPWIPSVTGPGEEVPVIQIARDPLYSRYPVRGFPLDVALAGDPMLSLSALRECLEDRRDSQTQNLSERKATYRKTHERVAEQVREREKEASGQCPISMYWVSHCLGEVADENTIFLSEYDLKAEQLHLRYPGSYFGSPSVSGLGWGFGAAIGAKLGAPEKTVICGLGDGAYLFSNPVACHMAAAAIGAPVLVVVFNNGRWNSVGAAVSELAPDGWAVSNNDYALVDLKPTPDYERIAEDCGGYGERVEDPAELPAAIQRVLHEVRVSGRQALLNVICA
jgi:acetolactate synthase-1/2/3 large subunit